jgi:putative MFS transporter
MAALDTAYPSELFPTSIRASATGICVSFSRIGAAIGTLLLPVGIEKFGAHGATLITGVVAGVGFLISIAWAPETAGLTLAQAAADTAETPQESASGSPDSNSPFVSQA